MGRTRNLIKEMEDRIALLETLSKWIDKRLDTIEAKIIILSRSSTLETPTTD